MNMAELTAMWQLLPKHQHSLYQSQVLSVSFRDHHLDADELAPVFHLLHPGEHEYARMQVLHQATAEQGTHYVPSHSGPDATNVFVIQCSSRTDAQRRFTVV